MTSPRPFSLSVLFLALGAALSAALCAPVHAQSLTELVESARTYDTTWQAARAQLDAAARRAEARGHAGRYLLTPLFQVIARTGAREVMIAAALFPLV